MESTEDERPAMSFRAFASHDVEHMKIAAGPMFLVAYFIAEVFGVPMVGPRNAIWFSLALSILFVWLYLSFSRGKSTTAVVAVLLVTLVLPLVILAVIVSPGYPSWMALVSTFAATAREHGGLWGGEMLLPFLGASGTAVLVNYRRSNISRKHESPSASA
jgi:hypothetical protein